MIFSVKMNSVSVLLFFKNYRSKSDFFLILPEKNDAIVSLEKRI